MIVNIYGVNMERTRLEIKDFLEGIKLSGAGYFTDERIEKLESLISECNYHHNLKEASESVVPDNIYDYLVEVLKKVKPDSNLLSHIWEEGDEDVSEYSYHLERHPMLSINTVKEYNNDVLDKFIENFKYSQSENPSLFASYKLNGHGIRVVYEDGVLVKATSRARNTRGRDITSQMVWVLGPENMKLRDLGLVELRGELVLPLSKVDKAREFNPDIKSAFSGVSSLIRPSTTKPEVELLDFIAYRLISDKLEYETKTEEYTKIDEMGYLTPTFAELSIDSPDVKSAIKNIVQAFELDYANYDYFCDGIVLEINDREIFHSLGDDGRANLGNVAMKVSLWGQDVYEGVIQRIEWTKGKSKLSPVAIVSEEGRDGVLTLQGNTVRKVPLYNPATILMLDAYPGKTVKFRYGGEAGVVPLTKEGNLLRDEVVRDLLS